MTEVAQLIVDVQNALSHIDADGAQAPSDADLSEWATKAHATIENTLSEVTLRLVDEPEMVELNQNFRGKTGSTNVLSFPVDNEFDLPNEHSGFLHSGSVAADMPKLLGDIVICHAVIKREALEQNKTITAHYAHMVTHGVLHLHGYDHLDDPSAEQMEALEATILSHSGFENPYT